MKHYKHIKQNWQFHSIFFDTWVGEVLIPNYYDEPKCPLCNMPCLQFAGTIGQDFMGNEEYGFWWHCMKCAIASQTIEVEKGDLYSD